MTSKLASKGFATRAVHAGERVRRDAFVPMSTPIYSSATFLYDTLEEIDAISAGARPGFTYSRHAIASHSFPTRRIGFRVDQLPRPSVP